MSVPNGTPTVAPTVSGLVETISYVYYDTVEVNGSLAGKPVLVFNDKKMNLSGRAKTLYDTNMQIMDAFPSGETTMLYAIGVTFCQTVKDMIDGSSKLWNLANRSLSFLDQSYLSLVKQSKEYLTAPVINCPSGGGPQLSIAMACADPTIPGVPSFGLTTNGVPTPAGLYILPNPILFQDKEPFTMTLGISPDVANGFPDPVANPLLMDNIQVQLHVNRTRPTQ